jgi:hypothetical protein
MAKELFEIKSFMSGTIITPSERDIKEDAASYSLNLDSVTKDGKLKSIPTDLYLASSWRVEGDVGGGLDEPTGIYGTLRFFPNPYGGGGGN